MQRLGTLNPGAGQKKIDVVEEEHPYIQPPLAPTRHPVACPLSGICPLFISCEPPMCLAFPSSSSRLIVLVKVEDVEVSLVRDG